MRQVVAQFQEVKNNGKLNFRHNKLSRPLIRGGRLLQTAAVRLLLGKFGVLDG